VREKAKNTFFSAKSEPELEFTNIFYNNNRNQLPKVVPGVDNGRHAGVWRAV
jgi:hypothetical protein